MCSPVGHHLQGPPLHQGECVELDAQGQILQYRVSFWKAERYWAVSQSCRWSVSAWLKKKKNMPVKANCLRGSTRVEHRSELAFSHHLWKDCVDGEVQLFSQSVQTLCVITWYHWSTFFLEVLNNSILQASTYFHSPSAYQPCRGWGRHTARGGHQTMHNPWEVSLTQEK